jgi:hypothetical protein
MGFLDYISHGIYGKLAFLGGDLNYFLAEIWRFGKKFLDFSR